MKKIDQGSEAELRVARYSSLFKNVEDAIKQAEVGVDMLMDQWENICTLNDYLDSGEWQADFEADERGEINKDIPAECCLRTPCTMRWTAYRTCWGR